MGDHGEGGAYVAFGGPSLAGADLSASVTYTGAGVGHDAGYSVAGAGDVNADGFDDVLIGSYFDDPDGWNWGAAYLILGGSGLTSGSLATAITFSGEGVADEAGVSVAGGGDVDGDGFDDVLVAAVHNADGGYAAGAAYLILGGSTMASANLSSALEFTGAAGDGVGEVALLGDVDGDGFDDMGFHAEAYSGSGSFTGAVYLLAGGPCLGSATMADGLMYTGESTYDAAGTSVSGAGDINGDGYADWLAGSYATISIDDGTHPIALYIVLGSSTPVSASFSTALKYTREATADYAGSSVSGAGDVDGDGFDDVLVGAPLAGGDASGAAYLLFGTPSPASGALASTVRLAGPSLNDEAGASVAGAGDLDGDGYVDILVGADFRQTEDPNFGSVFVLRGSGL